MGIYRPPKSCDNVGHGINQETRGVEDNGDIVIMGGFNSHHGGLLHIEWTSQISDNEMDEWMCMRWFSTSMY